VRQCRSDYSIDWFAGWLGEFTRSYGDELTNSVAKQSKAFLLAVSHHHLNLSARLAWVLLDVGHAPRRLKKREIQTNNK
jgi:hypothetical protein